ncbi:MAG: hypothetical protein ACI91Q_002011 [Gammaproteobacteria bacterium]
MSEAGHHADHYQDDERLGRGWHVEHCDRKPRLDCTSPHLTCAFAQAARTVAHHQSASIPLEATTLAITEMVELINPMIANVKLTAR